VNSPVIEGVSSLNSAVERTKTIKVIQGENFDKKEEIIILENKRTRKKRKAS